MMPHEVGWRPRKTACRSPLFGGAQGGMLPCMAENDVQPEVEEPAARPPTIWTRSGVVLLGLSVILWLPVPVVPFLSLSGADKVALGGGLIVAAEIAFWLGAALAGPEAARRMRSWFRGGRKRRSESDHPT